MADDKNFVPENDENVLAEDTVIVLTDDDGNDVEFEFLDNVEYEGDAYLVMLPKEDEDSGVVIMRVEEGETEEDDSLVTLGEDEADILDAVYEIFKANNSDIFDFEDD